MAIYSKDYKRTTYSYGRTRVVMKAYSPQNTSLRVIRYQDNNTTKLLTTSKITHNIAFTSGHDHMLHLAVQDSLALN